MATIRPEPVEGHVHGSTRSPRTGKCAVFPEFDIIELTFRSGGFSMLALLFEQLATLPHFDVSG